jgi:hypothetical protein
MIKLNLTEEEFLALLDGLAKAIDIQPVNHEKRQSKVDTIRQYGHDDFVRLLDGLKNNELTKPSEWFQAILYLYHHNELQLVDDRPIEDQIRQILVPLDAALHRADIIVIFLFLLITIIFCFFVFYELPWWESLLYTVVSFFPAAIISGLLISIRQKKATRLALNSFFELFPQEHPSAVERKYPYHFRNPIFLENSESDDIIMVWKLVLSCTSFHKAIINKLKDFKMPNNAEEILSKALE